MRISVRVSVEAHHFLPNAHQSTGVILNLVLQSPPHSFLLIYLATLSFLWHFVSILEDNMDRILFPTYDFASAATQRSAEEERDPPPSQGIRGGTTADGSTTAAQARSRWEGLTPLEMAEQVTKLAEDKMTAAQGNLLSKHRVDPSLMLSSSSNGNGQGKDLYADATNDGKKRGRKTVADVFGSDMDVPGMPGLGPSLTVPMPAMLPPWDSSYIIQSDPDPYKAKEAADTLGNLAAEVECSPNYHRCLSSYKRIREDLAAMSHMIHSKYYNAPTIRRSSLDDLYEDTIQKMQALAKMVKDIQPIAPVPMQVESTNESNDRAGPPSARFTRPKPKKNSKGEYSKKDFADYMNHWLRDNWTNPYPDDDGLAEIAEECGTTPTVVSNWLINARTRKWRPAIVKAYDLGRPADLLEEDAINLFDGNALRDIEGMPSLKTTSTKGKKGRGKKKK